MLKAESMVLLKYTKDALRREERKSTPSQELITFWKQEITRLEEELHNV